MMPAVTEWSRPNGEPIAIAHCPGLSALESPMRSAGNPVAGILSSATSDCSSLPTTLAVNSRPSDSLTVTSSAPSTTWWLVSTSRSEEHTSELQSLMRPSYAVLSSTQINTHPLPQQPQ